MASTKKDDNEVVEEARAFVQLAQESLSNAKHLDDGVRKRIQTMLNDLRHTIEAGEPAEVEEELEEVREFVQEHIDLDRKSALREYAESIGLAVVFALLLRGFVVEAFKIPTGSMEPTLLIGDHLFVNKFIYGIRVPFTETFVTRFGEPGRGEVVVFTFPVQEAKAYLSNQPSSERECIDRESLNHEKDFIKRVVAVEGDRVELRDSQLYINGEAVHRKFLKKESTGSYLYPHTIQEVEELGGHRYTIQYRDTDQEFGPVTVRDDHVFVMGDHRDRSSDSRCWGQVPIENIKGRAMFIWWSVGHEGYRWDRIGKVIN
jgi:signal peptidase I